MAQNHFVCVFFEMTAVVRMRVSSEHATVHWRIETPEKMVYSIYECSGRDGQ